MLELARASTRLCAPRASRFEATLRAGLPVRRAPPRARRHARRSELLGWEPQVNFDDGAARGASARRATAAIAPCRLGRRHRARARRPAVRALPRRARLHRPRHRHQRRRRSSALRAGRMPFREDGGQEALTATLGTRFFPGADLAGAAPASRPSSSPSARRSTSSTTRSSCRSRTCCAPRCRTCAPGQLLVLRSTVAPGATEHLGRLIERTHRRSASAATSSSPSARSASPRASRSPSCPRCRRSSAASTPRAASAPRASSRR